MSGEALSGEALFVVYLKWYSSRAIEPGALRLRLIGSLKYQSGHQSP